jgi:hypothetical protein
VEKLEGNKLLGRPRRRWEDIIWFGFTEIGWDGMGWINLVHDRDEWKAHLNTAKNLQVPYNVGKFLSS